MEEQKRLVDRWKTDSIPSSAISQCFFCVHKHNKSTCDAFPEGIPVDVEENRMIHNKPIEGDNGIMYKAKSPEYENISFIPFGKKKLY